MAPDNLSPRYVEPILGIVFDLDGTLILSHHDFGHMRRELIRIAERYGVVPGHLSVSEPIAHLIDQAHTELAGRSVPETTIFRMEAEIHKRIDDIEMEALPRTVPRPGATSLLGALQEKGYRLAVLTRSSEMFCRSALLKTGLDPYFAYLRTRSAPGPAKPSPEALRLLLHEMEVPPDRALLVGDHLLDAECGTRASIRFYGLLSEPPEESGMTVDRFQAVGAAAVARSLPELGRMLGVLPAEPPSPGSR